ARRGERINLAALRGRDLRDQMRGGAKSIQPEALAVAGHAVRAVADQPRAQERRGVGVAVAVRQLEHVTGVCDDELRVAAVHVIAREARVAAQVLAPALAILALAARVAEPRDADA